MKWRRKLLFGTCGRALSGPRFGVSVLD